MAKISIKMPEEFLNKINNLGEHTDEVLSKVLDAGARIVEEETRSRLKDVIGKDTKYPSKSTGQLVSSLGTSAARQDRNGVINVKVGFAENRTDGAKNAMLASILEYGKSNQKAKPFLKPAQSKSKKACIEAMEQKLNEEVSKL